MYTNTKQMKTVLQHNFQTKAHSLTGLFEGVKQMSNFMRRLEAQAQIDPLRYDPFKYVGDGFEFFIELFLMLYPCDKRIGISSYVPVQENDNGVDGIGINTKGEKSVIQVKYRTNTLGFLTANQDCLSNMFSDGMLAHNVIADMTDSKNYRHFIFTTAEGLNFYTDIEMFKSKVKCIGYNDFRVLLDDNLVFWQTALETVKQIETENKCISL
jgi:hypothetical protein